MEERPNRTDVARCVLHRHGMVHARGVVRTLRSAYVACDAARGARAAERVWACACSACSCLRRKRLLRLPRRTKVARMQSPPSGGSASRAARRRQIVRRRRAALAIGLAVVVLAVTAAYAMPTPQPAAIPQKCSAIALGSPTAENPSRVVVAELEGAQLFLPLPTDAITAVAFRPADDPNAVAFSPVGDRVDETKASKTQHAVQYYFMDGGGEERGPSTSALDVGGVPGSCVYAPVDGQVVAVKTYRLLGAHKDCELRIQLAADPSLLLLLSHIEDPVVHVGDRVMAGTTALGRLRGFPKEMQQDLSRYTNDAGDHVQLIALRVAPNLATF